MECFIFQNWVRSFWFWSIFRDWSFWGRLLQRLGEDSEGGLVDLSELNLDGSTNLHILIVPFHLLLLTEKTIKVEILIFNVINTKG